MQSGGKVRAPGAHHFPPLFVLNGHWGVVIYFVTDRLSHFRLPITVELPTWSVFGSSVSLSPTCSFGGGGGGGGVVAAAAAA